MNQPKGFITVFLAVFSLVLALTLFSSASFLQVIDKVSLSRHLCRTGLLKAQELAADSIDRLIELNPQVLRLFLELQSLKAQLSAAIVSVNLPLAAFLRKQILRVRAQQASLRKSQKLILKMGQAGLRAQVLQTRVDLERQMQRSFQQSPPEWKFSLSVWPQALSRLAVIESSMPEGPPQYKLEPSFFERQKITLRWQLNLSLAQWHQKWMAHWLQKEDRCSVSIRGEPLKLQPALAVDRFL